MSIKLPRLNVAVSDPKSGRPLREFSRFWDQAMSSIEAAINAIAATVASIEAILSGTTAFTALKINTTSYTDADLPKVGGANTWAGQQTFSVAPTAPSYKVGAAKVVGARDTGWTAGTGTASKAAFAAYAGQTLAATYSQTAAQATDDAAKAVSQRLLAIEQALTAHGLIGP